eukprot:g15650.t1
MYANVNTTDMGGAAYFMSYIFIVTILFTNLFIGIVLDAFLEVNTDGDGSGNPSESDHPSPVQKNPASPSSKEQADGSSQSMGHSRKSSTSVLTPWMRRRKV